MPQLVEGPLAWEIWLSHGESYEKAATGRGGKPSCGTGGGPHGQSQMFNLVNGVVPSPARIADATNDNWVGACGTRLLNGFKQTPVAGRPTASLPVHTHFTTRPLAGKSSQFLP